MKFQALLDATETPRERMVIALGLYLFLRSSEMESLTLQDINLQDGEIQVSIHKTVDADMMPISAELDYELRRYLTWYTEQMGVLHPQWFLIPYAFQKPYRNTHGRFDGQQNVGREWVFKPTTASIRLYEIVQKALESIGYETRSDSGKSHGEGVHTLRRSGARALFDDLRQQGYDGALQRVRSMLHHSSGAMTERYLGINMERRQRNDAIRGKKMFTLEAENVIQIGGRNGGSANAGM
jgi:integrase